MKKILMFLVLMIAAETVMAATLEDFCLGKYCLDDPIAKHGGLRAFKRGPFTTEGRPITQKDVGYPACTSWDHPVLTVFPVGQKRGLKETQYELTFTASPNQFGRGVENYYRITGIKVIYPEISKSDTEALYKKVTTKVGPPNNYGHWTLEDNKSFVSDVHVDIWSSRATIFASSMGKSATDRDNAAKAQPGCLSGMPNL